MSQALISVIQASDRLGTRKQTVFKVLKRLGIETLKQRHSDHRNQLIAYITEGEFRRVQEELATRFNGSDHESSESTTSPDLIPSESDLFYLIQLEPNHDPSRFKVGITSSMPERLRSLRCSAPFATELATWPCKRLWEKTAIECVSDGYEQLSAEVFRLDSLDEVKSKCQSFFDLMPECGNANREQPIAEA